MTRETRGKLTQSVVGAGNKLRRMISSPNALFAFEAVARCESFHAAAKELNVTQPSVSYQIKMLEKAVGVELFIRGGGRATLSQTGLVLARALDLGFRAIEGALNEIKRSTNNRVVTLCLSASQASDIWLPRLSSLRSKYPDIDINLRIVDHEVDPNEEDADISMRLGHGDWAGLSMWYLFPEVAFPICSPQYLERHGKIASLDDLASRTLLHIAEIYPRGISWREWFDKLGMSGYSARERLRFSDYQPLVEAAIMGEGVALGWAKFSNIHLNKGTLVRAMDLEVETGKAFYLVARQSQLSEMQHVESVRNWMLSEFGRLPADDTNENIMLGS